MASAPRLNYSLSFARRAAHEVDVELRIGGNTTPGLELAMASWAPGSYLMREFPRHVVRFAALAGGGKRARSLSWSKTDKNTWRIEGAPKQLVVRYTVYANELTVRTSHVDAAHAALVGSSVFMEVRGRRHEPYGVALALPRGWDIATGLGPRGVARGQRRFVAADYDELVDCPIEAGILRGAKLVTRRGDHRLFLCGRGNEELPRFADDCSKIADAAGALFGGDLPFDRYLFIAHVGELPRGGLEHRNSASLTIGRWEFEPAKDYEEVLALVAHEYVHAWNVKRIRPAALTDPELTREAYTRLLWGMEGLTDYLEEIVLRRARLVGVERLLERMATRLRKLEEQPGRLAQSLEDASFDTWIKHYRQHENSVNTQISYYEKGALVGWLLDFKLRKLTRGAAGVEALMRRLWQLYGQRGTPLPEDGIERTALGLAGRAGGAELRAFFDRHLRGTEELDLSDLAAFGLEVVRAPARAGRGKGPRAWLGVRTERRGDRVFVRHVIDGGPARRDGVDAGDELVALDGLRVVDEDWLGRRLGERRPGDRIRVTLFHGGELREVEVTLGTSPPREFSLRAVPRASAAAQALFRGWAGGALPARAATKPVGARGAAKIPDARRAARPALAASARSRARSA